MIYNAGTFRV